MTHFFSMTMLQVANGGIEALEAELQILRALLALAFTFAVFAGIVANHYYKKALQLEIQIERHFTKHHSHE